MRKLLLFLLSTLLLINLVHNSQVVYAEEKEIDVSYKDIRIILDNRMLNPTNAKGEKVEPFIYNGTTYLPIRAIAEALSLSVEWESTTSTISMEDAVSSEDTSDLSDSLDSPDTTETTEGTGSTDDTGVTDTSDSTTNLSFDPTSQDEARIVRTRYSHIIVALNKINIVLKGNTLELKDATGNIVEPIIYEGTTYLPVRAIASAMNKEVDWDSVTATVYLTTITNVN